MSGPGASRSEGLLFGLAPDGVFRASSITLRAVGFYSTFSPLPTLLARRRRFHFLWHCPCTAYHAAPRVYPVRTSTGYAASRSMEFGLSSPSHEDSERFSALPKSPKRYASSCRNTSEVQDVFGRPTQNGFSDPGFSQTLSATFALKRKIHETFR